MENLLILVIVMPANENIGSLETYYFLLFHQNHM